MSRKITIKDREKEMTPEQREVYDTLMGNGWVDASSEVYPYNAGKCYFKNKKKYATWFVTFDYVRMYAHSSKHGRQVFYNGNHFSDEVIDMLIGKKKKQQLSHF